MKKNYSYAELQRMEANIDTYLSEIGMRPSPKPPPKVEKIDPGILNETYKNTIHLFESWSGQKHMRTKHWKKSYKFKIK